MGLIVEMLCFMAHVIPRAERTGWVMLFNAHWMNSSIAWVIQAPIEKPVVL